MIKVDDKLLISTSNKAIISQRKRMNYNFHSASNDTLQRMLNAMEPGTYVQPHKHENPDKREVFLILSGKAVVVEFDDFGEVKDYITLDTALGNYGCEIPQRTWHTIFALEKNTVVYELKDGPYSPLDDKNFASWAPKENEPDCEEFMNNVLSKIEA